MKRTIQFISALMVGALLMFPGIGLSEETPNEELHKELRFLKNRIKRLETLQKDLDKKAEKAESEAPEPEVGLLNKIMDRISIGGLVEVGAGYKAVDNKDGSDDDSSDINLTTVEIGVELAVNNWINLETVFLYEDPFEGEESSFDLDVGTVTLGNPDEYPFYVSAGKMYVPFGALLTHLPDDPAVDQPMTLLMGEASEKAALVGYENSGISLSGYVFNGDMDESGDNTIESFGFDANYTTSEESPVELLVGASYISNIADSDGLTDYISGSVDELADYVGGLDAYLHLGFNNFFFDAEYMTALDEFDPTELAIANGSGAEPSVWNIEAGYNWNWGKNLEIVLKYAGSDETEALGFPEDRYGIGFNQEIFDGVTGSVAFFRDEYHRGDADGRDDRFTALGQIAIEF